MRRIKSEYLTEFPVRLAISFNLLKTPNTVSGGGVNMVRCVDLLPIATIPMSPFTDTSALICCELRPI